jgi:peptide methionine sulfoxide reductase MsrB
VKKELSSTRPDDSLGTRLRQGFGGQVRQTEVICAKCGSHSGHLFDDLPTKTGKRYCINSVCLNLLEKEKGTDKQHEWR